MGVTAQPNISRHNQTSHDTTKYLTAQPKTLTAQPNISRHNQIPHGTTKNSHGKIKLKILRILKLKILKDFVHATQTQLTCRIMAVAALSTCCSEMRISLTVLRYKYLVPLTLPTIDNWHQSHMRCHGAKHCSFYEKQH